MSILKVFIDFKVQISTKLKIAVKRDCSKKISISGGRERT